MIESQRQIPTEQLDMASGWAKDGAVQEQIDASVAEAVQRARSQMAQGAGLELEGPNCGSGAF